MPRLVTTTQSRARRSMRSTRPAPGMKSPGRTSCGPNRVGDQGDAFAGGEHREVAQERLRLVDRAGRLHRNPRARLRRRDRGLLRLRRGRRRRDDRSGGLLLELVDPRREIGCFGRGFMVDALAEFVDAAGLVVVDALDLLAQHGDGAVEIAGGGGARFQFADGLADIRGFVARLGALEAVEAGFQALDGLRQRFGLLGALGQDGGLALAFDQRRGAEGDDDRQARRGGGENAEIDEPAARRGVGRRQGFACRSRWERGSACPRERRAPREARARGRAALRGTMAPEFARRRFPKARRSLASRR